MISEGSEEDRGPHALVRSVDILFAPTAIPEQHRGRLLSWLSADEAARYARFQDTHARDAFLAGRALVRSAIGSKLARAPEDVALAVDRFGKPGLDDTILGGSSLAFNLSHSVAEDGNGIVGLAIFSNGDVGIDIERSRSVSAGLAERFFAKDEAAWCEGDAVAFLSVWTAKEACLKAWGRGVRGGLDAFVFAAPVPGSGAAWSLISVPEAAGDKSEWQVFCLDVPDAEGFASVAVRSSDVGSGLRVNVACVALESL